MSNAGLAVVLCVAAVLILANFSFSLDEGNAIGSTIGYLMEPG
jgi:hypothetical protein